MSLSQVVSTIIEAQKKHKADESGESAASMRKRYWNDDEHQRFLEALDRCARRAAPFSQRAPR